MSRDHHNVSSARSTFKTPTTDKPFGSDFKLIGDCVYPIIAGNAKVITEKVLELKAGKYPDAMLRYRFFDPRKGRNGIFVDAALSLEGLAQMAGGQQIIITAPENEVNDAMGVKAYHTTDDSKVQDWHSAAAKTTGLCDVLAGESDSDDDVPQERYKDRCIERSNLTSRTTSGGGDGDVVDCERRERDSFWEKSTPMPDQMPIFGAPKTGTLPDVGLLCTEQYNAQALSYRREPQTVSSPQSTRFPVPSNASASANTNTGTTDQGGAESDDTMVHIDTRMQFKLAPGMICCNCNKPPSPGICCLKETCFFLGKPTHLACFEPSCQARLRSQKDCRPARPEGGQTQNTSVGNVVNMTVINGSTGESQSGQFGKSGQTGSLSENSIDTVLRSMATRRQYASSAGCPEVLSNSSKDYDLDPFERAKARSDGLTLDPERRYPWSEPSSSEPPQISQSWSTPKPARSFRRSPFGDD